MSRNQLPAHPRLTRTAISCVGQYAEWLENYPRIIPPLLDWLFAAAQSSDVSDAASAAVKKIAYRNDEFMLQSADDFFSRALNVIFSTQRGNTRSHMTVACCHVLRMAPFEVIDKYSAQLMNNIREHLERLCQVQPTPESIPPLLEHIELLEAVSRSLRPERSEVHPLILLMEACLPCVQLLLVKYAQFPEGSDVVAKVRHCDPHIGSFLHFLRSVDLFPSPWCLFSLSNIDDRLAWCCHPQY